MTWQTIRILVAPPQHRNVTLSARRVTWADGGDITLRLQDMSQNTPDGKASSIIRQLLLRVPPSEPSSMPITESPGSSS